MSNFTGQLDDMDAEIADNLCDDALFRPAAGGSDVPCRVRLLRPSQTDQLQGAGIVRTHPELRVRLAEVASVVRGDLFVSTVDGETGSPTLEGRRWKVAAAPIRPGKGRWWVCDVEDTGPVP